jgi:PPM family protein phosphatase
MTQDRSSVSLHFEVAAKSDPGALRSLNEDQLFFDRELGLLVLADGMGGHKAGEVASALAVETLARELTASRLRGRSGDGLVPLLRKVIVHASHRVFAEAARRAQKSGNHPDQSMGTTLALLLLHESRATVAHVGDSRVYRWREGKLSLLTRDHSLLQDQIDRGELNAETALGSHNRHLVTRGIGHAPEVEVAFTEDAPQIDDIYLLCSDGLNDMLDDDEIELVLNAVGVNLQLTAEQLVMTANDAGGEDNVSVILARVRAGAAAAPKRRGFFAWLFRR